MPYEVITPHVVILLHFERQKGRGYAHVSRVVSRTHQQDSNDPIADECRLWLGESLSTVYRRCHSRGWKMVRV